MLGAGMGRDKGDDTRLADTSRRRGGPRSSSLISVEILMVAAVLGPGPHSASASIVRPAAH